MLYAVGLAVFAAAIVGVIPALKATGAALQSRLREAGATGSSMKLGRVWTGVIVAQAAITVVFLAAVVSLGWTVVRGQNSLDVTYTREHFLTAHVHNPAAPSSADTLRRIVERMKIEPGVLDATYTTSVPGTTWEQFIIEFPDSERTLAAEANARKLTDVLWSQGARVGPAFFETLGIPLIAGRLFTDAETLGGHHVAIVDETFVHTILGGRRALGLTVRQPASDSGAAPGPWLEIVGVVKDATVMTRKGPDDAVLYRPAGGDASPIRLVVRTQGAALPMTQRLLAAALSASPDARIAGAMPLTGVAEEEALTVRFFLGIFAVVGAVALLLSTGGIYALIAFTLARSTREIGIRVALGAAPWRIITSVFARAFRQVGIGVLAGALPGFAIIGAGAEDASGMTVATGLAVTLALCAFVVIVALISCATPLRRALRIAPTDALRAS